MIFLKPIGEPEDDPFLEDTGETLLGFPVYTGITGEPDWAKERRSKVMPTRGGMVAKFPTIGDLAKENTELRVKIMQMLKRINELESPHGEHQRYRIEMLERHLKEAEEEIIALRLERDAAKEELTTLQVAVSAALLAAKEATEGVI